MPAIGAVAAAEDEDDEREQSHHDFGSEQKMEGSIHGRGAFTIGCGWRRARLPVGRGGVVGGPYPGTKLSMEGR